MATGNTETGWKITWKHAECNAVPYLFGHLAILLNSDARTRQKFGKKYKLRHSETNENAS